MAEQSGINGLNESIIELNGKLERMMDGIDFVKENQEKMGNDIGKLVEAIYNPDEGLYARLRALEQWKETSTKFLWIVTTAVIMLVANQVWNSAFVQGP